jgi:mono/diheme cytochrome c family protein
MNKLATGVLSAVLSIALVNGVSAADKVMAASGKAEFRNSCSLCHGSDGKGGLPINDLLKTAPPDLTMLAKKNGGKFPTDRVAAMIDGRELVKSHGDRDMPAWGNRYSMDKVKAAEYYGDMPYKDTEMYVKNRMQALTEYLNSIQSK